MKFWHILLVIVVLSSIGLLAVVAFGASVLSVQMAMVAFFVGGLFDAWYTDYLENTE